MQNEQEWFAACLACEQRQDCKNLPNAMQTRMEQEASQVLVVLYKMMHQDDSFPKRLLKIVHTLVHGDVHEMGRIENMQDQCEQVQDLLANADRWEWFDGAVAGCLAKRMNVNKFLERALQEMEHNIEPALMFCFQFGIVSCRNYELVPVIKAVICKLASLVHVKPLWSVKQIKLIFKFVEMNKNVFTTCGIETAHVLHYLSTIDEECALKYLASMSHLLPYCSETIEFYGAPILQALDMYLHTKPGQYMLGRIMASLCPFFICTVPISGSKYEHVNQGTKNAFCELHPSWEVHQHMCVYCIIDSFCSLFPILVRTYLRTRGAMVFTTLCRMLGDDSLATNITHALHNEIHKALKDMQPYLVQSAHELIRVAPQTIGSKLISHYPLLLTELQTSINWENDDLFHLNTAVEQLIAILKISN